MEQKQSKAFALSLLGALSAGDVEAIIKGSEDARYWFENPQNWISYGGRPKNWDTVGNQQTNPVGALVELVTNGIDAILLRKAREEAALHLLARTSGIKSIRYEAPFFLLNNQLVAYLKYSTKGRSPWGFTFTMEEQVLLQSKPMRSDLKSRRGAKIFVDAFCAARRQGVDSAIHGCSARHNR